MKAMTEREFLAQKGLADPASGWCLDKLRANKELRTVQGKKRFGKEYTAAEARYQEARNIAKEEYRNLVEAGALRDKTIIERTLDRAQGHPDNESVQAARRMCAKRGYDWRTGEKIPTFQSKGWKTHKGEDTVCKSKDLDL